MVSSSPLRRTRSTSVSSTRHPTGWKSGDLIHALHRCAHGDYSSHRSIAHETGIPPSTLYKYWQALPLELQSGGDLLAITQWHYEYQSTQIINSHHTNRLLTDLEEEMLTQWVISAFNVYDPVGMRLIKDKAREIVKVQRGIELARRFEKMVGAVSRAS